jgi:hypothetical protein
MFESKEVQLIHHEFVDAATKHNLWFIGANGDHRVLKGLRLPCSRHDLALEQ